MEPRGVHIAGPGAGPQDGFKEYAALGTPVTGAGRYSAAVSDSDGSIFGWAEYSNASARRLRQKGGRSVRTGNTVHLHWSFERW